MYALYLWYKSRYLHTVNVVIFTGFLFCENFIQAVHAGVNLQAAGFFYIQGLIFTLGDMFVTNALSPNKQTMFTVHTFFITYC